MSTLIVDANPRSAENAFIMVHLRNNRVENREFTIKQIGIIRTSYTTKESCPIQGNVNPEMRGTIEVFQKYEEALKDIETFSHIYFFYIFDQAGEVKLVRNTFLDDAPHGIFASRHPCRINKIGISVVKLKSRNKNILGVGGIDILDKTPLIDIKPYIPRFDIFEGATNGWTESKKLRPKPLDRE